jgi:hypothetical protein
VEKAVSHAPFMIRREGHPASAAAGWLFFARGGKIHDINKRLTQKNPCDKLLALYYREC